MTDSYTLTDVPLTCKQIWKYGQTNVGLHIFFHIHIVLEDHQCEENFYCVRIDLLLTAILHIPGHQHSEC